MKNQYELVPEQLIRIFDPTIFDFAESEAASQKQNIIGQSRAVAALQFGLGINKEGFHIYVSGPHGTGRMTAVKMFLEQIAQKQETPQDWCYVNNFDDAYRPKALALPSGKGKEFQQDVSYFIEVVKKGIPKVFQQEQYTNQRDTLIREFEELKSKKVEELKTQAGTLGFQAEFGTEGILLLPIVNGKPITDNDVQTIPPQEQEEILKKRKILESSIKARIKELRDIDQQAHEKFRVFEKEYVSRI
ncbi:MAG TPA: Lon-like protease helical domain-containing protein, partial [Acidobacteriota bacterium]|nr:Lon-like protease helical domain-containing protein [Acidobacteriota bacterium]